MKRYATFAMLIGMLGLTSCGVLFPGLSLGFDLLVAITTAPEGEKVCAAFDVLDTETTGRRISALLNGVLSQTESTVRFTEQEGEELLNVIRAVNCEFVTCFIQEVEALDPPTEEMELRDWVSTRSDALQAIADDCPNAILLSPEQIIQTIRLNQGLEN